MVSLLHAARYSHPHILFVEGVYGLAVHKADSARIRGVALFGGHYLYKEYLPLFVGEVIHGFFPVASSKEVGNDYAESVALRNFGTDYGLFKVGVIFEFYVVKRAHRAEEGRFADNQSVRVFAHVAFYQSVRQLIHIMYG